MAFISATESTPPQLPFPLFGFETMELWKPTIGWLSPLPRRLNSPPQLYKRSLRPQPFVPQPVLTPTFFSSHSRTCHQAPPPPTCPPHSWPISAPLPPIHAASKGHQNALLLLPLPRWALRLYSTGKPCSGEPLRAPPLRVHHEPVPRRVHESIDSFHRFFLWKIIHIFHLIKKFTPRPLASLQITS
jgi:hypothetical protein